jgi:hypothetical protein
MPGTLRTLVADGLVHRLDRFVLATHAATSGARLLRLPSLATEAIAIAPPALPTSRWASLMHRSHPASPFAWLRHSLPRGRRPPAKAKAECCLARGGGLAECAAWRQRSVIAHAEIAALGVASRHHVGKPLSEASRRKSATGPRRPRSRRSRSGSPGGPVCPHPGACRSACDLRTTPLGPLLSRPRTRAGN